MSPSMPARVPSDAALRTVVACVPTLFAPSSSAAKRFLEFFAAQIRNLNNRHDGLHVRARRGRDQDAGLGLLGNSAGFGLFGTLARKSGGLSMAPEAGSRRRRAIRSAYAIGNTRPSLLESDFRNPGIRQTWWGTVSSDRRLNVLRFARLVFMSANGA